MTELSDFANRISGLPSHLRFHFRCVDNAGHARVYIALEDDHRLDELATSQLGFFVLAGDVDRFTTRRRAVEKEQFGEAHLAMGE